ncbi:MAG: AbrB/MazE/SpoVT family DNA-binding domain-containing protein, partial [Nanoarchaeota archaeon]
MKRRLIKQSRSTLTVSMPSTWIQKNNLKAGDELDVFERETTLLLEATKKKGEYNFELKIDKDNAWYIGQIIRYCYFANFEKTRLFFTSV